MRPVRRRPEGAHRLLQVLQALLEPGHSGRHIGKEHCWECEVPGCLLRFAQKQKLEEHALTAHRLDIKVRELWLPLVTVI